MKITTILISSITNYNIDQLIEKNVYNLLVLQQGKLVDIRCRIISIGERKVLVFKLED